MTFQHSIYCALTLAAGLFAGCNDGFVFDETQAIKGEYWSYADSLRYTVEISDTTQRYDIIAHLVHSDDYPSENVYVNIGTKFPNGTEQQNPVSLELANSRGEWYGKTSGGEVGIDIVLQERARLVQKGKYVFSFRQYTRSDSLAGIKSIALRLKKSAAAAQKPK